MLNTPLGKIRILKNQKEVDYIALSHNVDTHSIKEKPLAGCYRINIDFEQNDTISCELISSYNLEKDNASGEDYACKTFSKNNIELSIGAYDKIDRCQLSKDLLCISDYYLSNRKFKFKDLEEEQSFKKDIYNSDTLELLVLLAPLSMFTISTQSDYRTAGIYNSNFWFYDKDNFDVIRDSFAHGSFYKYANRNIYFRDYYQSRSGEVTDRHISINRNDIVNFLDELTKMACNYISNHLDNSTSQS